jgi:solute carrier family 13 (sodium-dependent dicarboxylate transporter), member 2/3/5
LFFYLSLGKERKEFVPDFKAETNQLSRDQKKVIAIFLGVVICWIFKDVISGKSGIFPQLKYGDETVAILGAILMLLIPTSDKEKEKTLLAWKDTQHLPWGILIMFGGGLALAKCLDYGGVIDSISNAFSGLAGSGYFVILLVMVLISVFGTELLSNLTLVTLFVPIIGAFCIKSDVPVLALCIPWTLAASCAFMMPVGTPPNAIAFSSEKITMRQMAGYGFVINLIGTVVIVSLSYFLLR